MRVTEYTLEIVPPGHYLRDRYDDMDIWTITINDRQTAPDKRWGVYLRGGNQCLNIETGEWDHEPMPSSRDDEWFANHRSTLDVAETAAIVAATHQLTELERKHPEVRSVT